LSDNQSIAQGPDGAYLQFEWDPVKAAANLAKHRVAFAQSVAVFTDALALTVFDEQHSTHEERWFTLGTAGDGKLLAVSHTYVSTNAASARIRIISAREATRNERRQYEGAPRAL
jgi:uncharacterized protein